jgi:hypothetical protein
MRRAIVLVTTALLGGCVLLVDPIETSDHCGIAGAGECADCLRTKCQVPIDRCCANAECRGQRMLPAIDACGSGDTASCADMLSSPRIQKEEEALRSCASSACGRECTKGSPGTGADNRPKWTCATPRDMGNVCAACIYQRCAANVDSCCTDSACSDDSSIQLDMAACVSGDVAGCAYILNNARSKSGQSGVLRKCITDECASSCMGNGLPHTKCTLQAGGQYCSCTNDEIAGTTSCKKADVDGDCVLGSDGCTCGQYTCSDDASGGCGCDFFGGGVVGTSCTAMTDKVCCAKQDTYSIKCECRYSSCSGSEAEITSCSREDVLAWADGAAVDSCSR